MSGLQTKNDGGIIRVSRTLTPEEELEALKAQSADKDRMIAELNGQVSQLMLAVAQLQGDAAE